MQRRIFNQVFIDKALLKKHNVVSEAIKTLSKCIYCEDKTFSKKILLIEYLNTQYGMCEMLTFASVSGTYNILFIIFIYLLINVFYYILEFQNWLKEYELKYNCQYSVQTGKRIHNDVRRSYYECSRSGIYKEKDDSKRLIKSQGTKKINLNCTSHIMLVEPLNQSNCNIIFYKEHYGHNENELQHIGLPITKKHEVAAKLSQGVTIGRILDDFRDKRLLGLVCITSSRSII